MTPLPFKVISIHGAPRSGTSWLGKIFDSHPDVAYRFQPLFSYRFKAAIDTSSRPAEIRQFLQDLHAVQDDEFILQLNQKARGVHPHEYEKIHPAAVLVMKEVRYHYVIETLLQSVPGIKILGIVRHPCGVINSWLKTPREFRPEWDPETEWRRAPSKNQGRPEEYYGFEKWQELARLFLRLQAAWPQSFLLLRYEDLIRNTAEEIEKALTFCGMRMHPQVAAFIAESHAREIEDPDTVFRTTDVAERWRHELDPRIRDAILRELAEDELSVFLD